jgi:hypothetical protein
MSASVQFRSLLALAAAAAAAAALARSKPCAARRRVEVFEGHLQFVGDGGDPCLLQCISVGLVSVHSVRWFCPLSAPQIKSTSPPGFTHLVKPADAALRVGARHQDPPAPYRLHDGALGRLWQVLYKLEAA